MGGWNVMHKLHNNNMYITMKDPPREKRSPVSARMGHGAGLHSGNAFESYSGDVAFESWLEHRLS
jgi:hypothetical protein